MNYGKKRKKNIEVSKNFNFGNLKSVINLRTILGQKRVFFGVFFPQQKIYVDKSPTPLKGHVRIECKFVGRLLILLTLSSLKFTARQLLLK